METRKEKGGKRKTRQVEKNKPFSLWKVENTYGI
jgi:hypothetical protein